MKINFLAGVREEIVKIGLLSEWDNGDRETREQHDKEIREKYNRIPIEDVNTIWKSS